MNETYYRMLVGRRCKPPSNALWVRGQKFHRQKRNLTAEFQAAAPPQLEDPDGVEDGTDDETDVGPEVPEAVDEPEMAPMLLRMLSHLLVG